MEQSSKKKGRFLIKMFFALLIFVGIVAYAYHFPVTMELFDREVNKVFAMAGMEEKCGIFSDFSELSRKAVDKAIYWIEVIKSNIEGNISEGKSVPLVVFTCAADFPAEGEWVTSDFGKRTNPLSGKDETHTGIDITAAEGSEITPAWPGTVFETGSDEIYGYYIIIEHSEGFFTKYCHLSKISIEENDFVNVGEKIGEAGSTGWSTGSHLHFEVSVEGMNIDPKECFAA